MNPNPVLSEIHKLRTDYVIAHGRRPTRLLIDQDSFDDLFNEPRTMFSDELYLTNVLMGMDIFLKHIVSKDGEKCIIVE